MDKKQNIIEKGGEEYRLKIKKTLYFYITAWTGSMLYW